MFNQKLERNIWEAAEALEALAIQRPVGTTVIRRQNKELTTLQQRLTQLEAIRKQKRGDSTTHNTRTSSEASDLLTVYVARRFKAFLSKNQVVKIKKGTILQNAFIKWIKAIKNQFTVYGVDLVKYNTKRRSCQVL